MEVAKYNTKDFEIVLLNYDGEVDKLNFTIEDCNKNTIFKKELDNGIVKTDDNVYLVSITPDDTKNMDVYFKYKYFIEIIINSPQFVYTSKTGDFILKESSKELGGEINGEN